MDKKGISIALRAVFTSGIVNFEKCRKQNKMNVEIDPDEVKNAYRNDDMIKYFADTMAAATMELFEIYNDAGKIIDFYERVKKHNEKRKN